MSSGCQKTLYQNTTLQLRYLNGSECHPDVKQSVCKYGRLKVFSLGIKMTALQCVCVCGRKNNRLLVRNIAGTAFDHFEQQISFKF